MPQLVRVQNEVETTVKVELQWQEHTLIFKMNSRIYPVDSLVYGTLAIHSKFIGPPIQPFVITHKPSLIRVAGVKDQDEAMAQAEWLWECCPRAWAGEVVDKSLLTTEMLEWLMKNK